MTITLNALLDQARLPVAAAPFDVAQGLRRLAADAARRTPTTDVHRAAQAGQRLKIVCRWVLNEPDSARHISKIAEDPGLDPLSLLDADRMDADGTLVYACLLHLTGHSLSAQFWWQLAAGADSRPAAYCLHLHHLAAGESKRARHWYYQVTRSTAGADSLPPDTVFLTALEIFARYVRANGSRALPPDGALESEVDRLAAQTPVPGFIALPDRRLVARLEEFTAGR
ncbi:hypothetical protein ABZX40_38440 [Streptomyces sp. NPDC004610]|uniref:hypothetical protein n=1 Tax=unclassified Streptomyces TaxID=2593676 RepID=UPI00339E681C